jgi:hypothetical protein
LFERFTDESRQVVMLAHEEARGLGHSSIGTEHILLGLLRVQNGTTARLFETFGVTLEPVRERVVGIAGCGDEISSGQLPFTPRAKKVLELSLREALSVGDNYIDLEHILLGLARAKEGVAARILLEFGADAESVRDRIFTDRTRPKHPLRATLPWPRPGVRPRPRRAAPERWEYRIEQWPASEVLERQELLNGLGAEGWQLGATVASGDQVQFVFQRTARLKPESMSEGA